MSFACENLQKVVGHYYSLDLESPQTPGIKGLALSLVLLGGRRTIKRWGLVEVSQIIGGMPLKGILGPWPLLVSLSLLFGHHDCEQLPLSHVPIMNALP